MIEWREEFDAVVASDVGRRDGLGWEFTDRAQRQVWAVFREDAGTIRG